MSYTSEVEQMERPHPLSWSAVGAGAIAGLIIHFLLNLLGLGIGATNVEAVAGADADTVSGGGFAWWAVSGILAAAAGGIIAWRMAKQGAHMNAMSHGLAAWAVSTLVVVAAIGGALGGGAITAAGPRGAQLAEYGDAIAEARVAAATPEETAALTARAEAAADRVGAGALISFVSLVLGAAAAAFSARWAGNRVRVGEPVGARRPMMERVPRYRDGDETRPH